MQIKPCSIGITISSTPSRLPDTKPENSSTVTWNYFRMNYPKVVSTLCENRKIYATSPLLLKMRKPAFFLNGYVTLFPLPTKRKRTPLCSAMKLCCFPYSIPFRKKWRTSTSRWVSRWHKLRYTVLSMPLWNYKPTATTAIPDASPTKPYLLYWSTLIPVSYPSMPNL